MQLRPLCGPPAAWAATSRGSHTSKPGRVCRLRHPAQPWPAPCPLPPRSFPGLEKRAKSRPAAALYRVLTVADPVLDPVRGCLVVFYSKLFAASYRLFQITDCGRPGAGPDEEMEDSRQIFCCCILNYV